MERLYQPPTNSNPELIKNIIKEVVSQLKLGKPSSLDGDPSPACSLPRSQIFNKALPDSTLTRGNTLKESLEKVMKTLLIAKQLLISA